MLPPFPLAANDRDLPTIPARRDGYSPTSAGSPDGRVSMLRQFCGFTGEPNEHVSIEQDHFVVLSHSTGIGDSISPTILTFPDIDPKMSIFSGWAGITLTIGVPRLVTMTGSP